MCVCVVCVFVCPPFSLAMFVFVYCSVGPWREQKNYNSLVILVLAWISESRHCFIIESSTLSRCPACLKTYPQCNCKKPHNLFTLIRSLFRHWEPKYIFSNNYAKLVHTVFVVVTYTCSFCKIAASRKPFDCIDCSDCSSVETLLTISKSFALHSFFWLRSAHLDRKMLWCLSDVCKSEFDDTTIIDRLYKNNKKLSGKSVIDVVNWIYVKNCKWVFFALWSCRVWFY